MQRLLAVGASAPQALQDIGGEDTELPCREVSEQITMLPPTAQTLAFSWVVILGAKRLLADREVFAEACWGAPFEAHVCQSRGPKGG